MNQIIELSLFHQQPFICFSFLNDPVWVAIPGSVLVHNALCVMRWRTRCECGIKPLPLRQDLCLFDVLQNVVQNSVYGGNAPEDPHLDRFLLTQKTKRVSFT